jgi:probable FeS assembly SUF system protein SufT
MIDNERTLTRDVPATIVPYGDQVTIPADTVVTITHRLGGNFTVTWSGGMAQINGVHAEALGEESTAPKGSGDTSNNHEGPPTEETIWEALRGVFDPEIPVNIVDLGLIYNLNIEEGDTDDTWNVKVDMTLTAPGCGMGPVIAQDAKMKIETVPGVSEATVDIVWDPPWHQDMISEAGKMELGLL